MHTLKIENLKVEIEGKIILNDFSLAIKSGEIHVIMGPNGAGKSTLSKIIMGDSNYKVLEGNIYFDDINITNLKVDERAKLGIFLSMQYPQEIEGVTNADFLRTVKLTTNPNDFKLYEFIKELDSNVSKLEMDPKMIHRGINVGFSGGERKKNEILQMNILKPNTIILDEIDSGLDVDSLKIVGQNVMEYYNTNECSLLLITHYQRLLDYIKPDYVHVIYNGKIIKTGTHKLVQEIEKDGYQKIIESEISSTSDVTKK